MENIDLTIAIICAEMLLGNKAYVYRNIIGRRVFAHQKCDSQGYQTGQYLGDRHGSFENCRLWCFEDNEHVG